MNILYKIVNMSVKNNSFKYSQIVRDQKLKEVTLIVNTLGRWQLYAGYSVESIDNERPVAEGMDSGVFLLNMITVKRSYFRLHTEYGDTFLAERHIPIEGSYNTRDLGGYYTRDNRQVKWGKLFRSDDIQNITVKDYTYLSLLPIYSIIDFRALPEKKYDVDKIPSSVRKIFPLSIDTGNLSQERVFAFSESGNLETLMEYMNEALVGDRKCVERYREFFRIIQKENDVPVMFHCSAGKDRTGMAAALILYALGVEEDVIMQDYMMSKDFLKDKYSPIVNKYPKTAPMFTAKPEYLQAGINLIKKEFNSVENYLENVLDVDIEKMKKLYLYS